jgi:hypothetical protein
VAKTDFAKKPPEKPGKPDICRERFFARMMIFFSFFQQVVIKPLEGSCRASKTDFAKKPPKKPGKPDICRERFFARMMIFFLIFSTGCDQTAGRIVRGF